MSDFSFIIVAFVCDKPNDVLKLLQSALEFDLCNVTMRWNATLLLWRLGEKEEALKTWCKTRGIDYRLNTQEVMHVGRSYGAPFVKRLYRAHLA